MATNKDSYLMSKTQWLNYWFNALMGAGMIIFIVFVLKVVTLILNIKV